MKPSELRQIIKESIQDYVKEIEQSGNRAALEAKIAKIGEAIELREKKINMDGLDEEMKDMINPKKVKELKKEVSALQKSLTKYKATLDKMDGKTADVETEVETEVTDEVIDEVKIEDETNESHEAPAEHDTTDENFNRMNELAFGK